MTCVTCIAYDIETEASSYTNKLYSIILHISKIIIKMKYIYNHEHLFLDTPLNYDVHIGNSRLSTLIDSGYFLILYVIL